MNETNETLKRQQGGTVENIIINYGRQEVKKKTLEGPLNALSAKNRF